MSTVWATDEDVEDIELLFDDIKSAAISAVLALHPGNGEPEV